MFLYHRYPDPIDIVVDLCPAGDRHAAARGHCRETPGRVLGESRRRSRPRSSRAPRRSAPADPRLQHHGRGRTSRRLPGLGPRSVRARRGRFPRPGRAATGVLARAGRLRLTRQSIGASAVITHGEDAMRERTGSSGMTRGVRGWRFLEELRADVRYGLRWLTRSPGSRPPRSSPSASASAPAPPCSACSTRSC